ncbi:Mitogen-activated protein kinase kinase kinase ANP1 [Apostasia shenzhenica]|uniref:Mitogen-activated protein kinase kinase kinase ANP1 n=1 Tax=Apostasia shenzhenica TaxID=1088818 RepID=A0A2I0A1J4_9ASPA|nr:Mitogen-activated protein kinase kinase kinase ANP1 [Apostasia shenzhenica]
MATAATTPMERKKYPIRAEDYELYETIGQGASAVVHRALCIPFNEIVAVKIIDFERQGSDMGKISREAQTMILIDHPNVLRAHCSFVHDHNLWVIMPFMGGGSCLHIMKSAFPDGFEEMVIATILKEVLKGLEYLHRQGHIHRDVKAGNILVDAKGGIKLGDFGVSACLFDSGDRQRTRNTLAGTPCWMAPEVLEQLYGYDFKADIWSFGITALELAHGHAPFSKYPPSKVLLLTLQYAPPGLDYESDKKFSKNFKHMIASCLVKDPTKRPTARKLLKHAFFRQARSLDYITKKLLEGLPGLGDRYKALKEKEQELLAQRKMPDVEKEEISQNEYKRGISGWNFDIEDLKAQASLIPDFENDNLGKDQGSSGFFFEPDNPHERMTERSYSRICSFKEYDGTESEGSQNKLSILPLPDAIICCQSRSDCSDNESKNSGTSDQPDFVQLLRNDMDNHVGVSCRTELNGLSSHSVNERNDPISPETFDKNVNGGPSHELRIFMTCPTDIPSSSKGESLKQQNQPRNCLNFSGDVSPNESLAEVVSKSIATNGDDLDDKSKAPIVQQKGRFKVTSESTDFDKASPPTIALQKSHSMQVISQAQIPSLATSADAASSFACHLFQRLLSMLQNNIVQRDHILSLMKQMSAGDPLAYRSVDGSILSPTAASEKSLLDAANEREKDLLHEISDLQRRLIGVADELQRLKEKNVQV